jgi:hypothetical protein
MSEWFGYKYKVTPETSKLLQEAVFKGGGGWGHSLGKDIRSTCTHIFITVNGEMTYISDGDDRYFVEESALPEKQLTQPTSEVKSFKVGKWYKCVDKYGRNGTLIVGKYYRINELSKIESICILDALCFWWDLSMFDINSESDFNPDAVDPYKHTAYVKFKGSSGKYDSKEYCYKCDDSVLSKHIEQLTMKEVYASVNVSGEIKTVQIQRIAKDFIDSKATKCIIGIVEEEKTKSRLDDVVQVTINRDDFFSKEMTDYLSVSKSGNNATTNVGDVNMSVQRKSVKVELFDNDQGLPVEYSLVGSWVNYVTEDSDGITVQEIISTGVVADLLQQHNAVRVDLIDEEILTRTGNSVNLRH